MRIISPYKDFYDFVVNETDNRKVYLRDTKEIVYDEDEHKKSPERTLLSPITYKKMYAMRIKSIHPFQDGQFGVIAFCDRLRSFLIYKNVRYWHYEDVPEDIIKALEKLVTSKWGAYDSDDYERYSWFRDPLKDMLRFKKIDWVLDYHTKVPIITNLNKIFNTPILQMLGVRNIILNPKLSEIGFNKVITPTEAYQQIYNWIPYNEPVVPSSPNDMNRYEAKGFDKKTSFRPNMKS